MPTAKQAAASRENPPIAMRLNSFIEELPGANTQGETLEEARENLNGAVALVLKANRVLVEQSLEGVTVIRETFALPAA
jgi:hypothetical protein